jgi:ABC-type enterobactin transport system permease subunit
MLALKNADQEFALKMQELGFTNAKDMEALAAGDRSDARKRESIVLDKTPRNLAYFVVGGFFSILVFMMFSEVPVASRDILNIMLGALGGSFSGVIGYYFGSTAGSKEKNVLLAKADSRNYLQN